MTYLTGYLVLDPDYRGYITKTRFFFFPCVQQNMFHKTCCTISLHKDLVMRNFDVFLLFDGNKLVFNSLWEDLLTLYMLFKFTNNEFSNKGN
mgnify:CR=1 FL=1